MHADVKIKAKKSEKMEKVMKSIEKWTICGTD